MLPNTQTGEDYVVYMALYGDNQIYIRPLDMFLSKVDREKYPEVDQKYRFENVNIESVKKKEKGGIICLIQYIVKLKISKKDIQ